MNDNTALNVIKKMINEQVAAGIKLQKPPDENNPNIERVNPYVCIGYLPPKNFLPEGYDVPGIIVGLEDGEDDNDEANLQIKLTFVTYGAGSYDETGQLIPDMEGYMDLLNLMHRTRLKISTMPIIEKTTVVQKPIKWGMYQEQPWPYWYGWMTFGINGLIYNMKNPKEENYL